MGDKLSDAIGPALRRSFDDTPVRLRSLRDVVDGLKAKQVRNRDGVADVDKPADKPGPVRIDEAGTFSELKKRETPHDGLQHDHIPSAAALVRAQELAEGGKLSAADRAAIRRNGVAVEVSDQIHSQSRTYKGRNSPHQIAMDASDLRAAMERDVSVYRANLENESRLTSGEIDSVMQQIRELNMKRGIG